VRHCHDHHFRENRNIRDGYITRRCGTHAFREAVAEGDDKDLILWQVLLHAGNRPSRTAAQTAERPGRQDRFSDQVFYAYDHL
jgi:hypothetical protein